ncbi:MAG TPA: SWIM zinc finger family protein [Roseiarcus sp.]|nr:SWIM zinc finger family protein [Roseiarcus sp.]
MNAKGPDRFDVDALRHRAGAKVFERGAQYHRDGQVRILALQPGRVLAHVAGSEDYRSEVIGRGKEIGGECSCRAFEDLGFCKHMVAAALAANGAGADAEADSASARIREHLKAKGVAALVEMILNFAERDPVLFRKLETASIALSADGKVLETRLRKAIDDATRIRGFVDYREAGGWTSGVKEALDLLADLAAGAHAGLALELAERAIDRIEQAAEKIDDSEGHCRELLNFARDIHLAAARAARPEPVRFARDLVAREIESDLETFNGAAALYADALGEKGLAEYRRLATEAWEKLPARLGRTPESEEFSYDHDRLLGILDFFAERDGDVETRIALRAKDLSSPWDYLQLAEFCLSQGRSEEALRRAEEGLWLFEDGRPDEGLVLFAAGLLAKAGRGEDAEARLWRAFEKAPSLGLYNGLRNCAGANARERAAKFLEERLAKSAGSYSTDADLLIDILTREKMYAAAWASLRKHGGSASRKKTLAAASEKQHPREALQTYAEEVEQLASNGGNSGYAQAAALIARMRGLRSAAEQAAYVAALKQRFVKKRNFMKLLE